MSASKIHDSIDLPTLTKSNFIKNVKVPTYAFPTIILATCCFCIHFTIVYTTYKNIINEYTACLINTVVVNNK